jgi:hypothetical protein
MTQDLMVALPVGVRSRWLDMGKKGSIFSLIHCDVSSCVVYALSDAIRADNNLRGSACRTILILGDLRS